MEKIPKTSNKAFQPDYRVTMTTKLKIPLLHIKLLKKMPMVEAAWNPQIYDY